MNSLNYSSTNRTDLQKGFIRKYVSPNFGMTLENGIVSYLVGEGIACVSERNETMALCTIGDWGIWGCVFWLSLYVILWMIFGPRC